MSERKKEKKPEPIKVLALSRFLLWEVKNISLREKESVPQMCAVSVPIYDTDSFVNHFQPFAQITFGIYFQYCTDCAQV